MLPDSKLIIISSPKMIVKLLYGFYLDHSLSLYARLFSKNNNVFLYLVFANKENCALLHHEHSDLELLASSSCSSARIHLARRGIKRSTGIFHGSFESLVNILNCNDCNSLQSPCKCRYEIGQAFSAYRLSQYLHFTSGQLHFLFGSRKQSLLIGS